MPITAFGPDPGSRCKAGELAAAIGKLYGAGGLIVYSHPDLPEIPPGEIRSAVRNLVDMRERDEKMLDDRAGNLEALLGSRPEVRLSGDYPAKVLLDASQEVQPSLVAVGSRGQAGAGVSTRRVRVRHQAANSGHRLEDSAAPSALRDGPKS